MLAISVLLVKWKAPLFSLGWGKYNRYPELHKANTNISTICKDKVHLSQIGKHLFLFNATSNADMFAGQFSSSITKTSENGPHTVAVL